MSENFEYIVTITIVKWFKSVNMFYERIKRSAIKQFRPKETRWPFWYNLVFLPPYRALNGQYKT